MFVILLQYFCSAANSLLLHSFPKLTIPPTDDGLSFPLHSPASLEPESPLVVQNSPVDARPDWPEAGAVVAKNLVCSYRPDLPPVINDISFSIAAGQVVG